MIFGPPARVVGRLLVPERILHALSAAHHVPIVHANNEAVLTWRGVEFYRPLEAS